MEKNWTFLFYWHSPTPIHPLPYILSISTKLLLHTTGSVTLRGQWTKHKKCFAQKLDTLRHLYLQHYNYCSSCTCVIHFVYMHSVLHYVKVFILVVITLHMVIHTCSLCCMFMHSRTQIYLLMLKQNSHKCLCHIIYVLKTGNHLSK
jgi:hypothetical protein